MAVTPATNQNPPPDLTNAPPGQTIGYFQAIFTKAWGAQAGATYAAFAKHSPNLSPYQAAQAFGAIIASKGLQKGLQQFANLVGSIPSAAINAAQAGANVFIGGGLPSGTASPAITKGIVLILAVFVMTWIAGINEQLGKLTTVVMSGFLLGWFLNNETEFGKWVKML